MIQVQDQGSGQFSSWWGFAFWFADGCLFTMSLHRLSSARVGKGRGRERALVSLLIRTLIVPGLVIPMFMTSFNLNYFLKAPSPNTAIPRVRAFQLSFFFFFLRIIALKCCVNSAIWICIDRDSVYNNTYRPQASPSLRVMCLRYVLHPFTEGSWANWAQITLNCDLLINLPFLPPLALSFLESLPQ